jgi:hypothetical protein
VRIWEPAEAFYLDGDGAANAEWLQCVDQILHPFLGPFADEFRRQMQVIDRRPLELGVWPQPLDEPIQISRYFFR